MNTQIQQDPNRPKRMRVRQVNTDAWFFWNGICWVCERNGNVKISDENMEFDLKTITN